MCIVALNIANLTSQAHEIKYIPYILELSCATYCNLTGSWKFLNGYKLDVHNSPDPLSSQVRRRGYHGYVRMLQTDTVHRALVY